MATIPRFLKIEDGQTVGTRPRLHIDEVYENGTVLDTVRERPSYRTRLIKKTKRKLQEAEELRAFLERKRAKTISLSQLKDILENDGAKGDS